MQRVYFVLESLEQLFEIASRDLIVLINKARSKGLKTRNIWNPGYRPGWLQKI
jgi:phenylalanine-4-hydroxylase